MESRPARGYLDLLVAFGLLAVAAAATLLSLDGIARLAALIPTVVFLPGYAVVSMTYPTSGSPPEDSTIGPSGTGLKDAFSRGNHGIGGIERLALAVLWSVVVVPAVALAVHFSPFPIAAGPIQVGVLGTTAVLLVGAVVSRARQSLDDRFSPSVPSLSTLLGGSTFGLRQSSALGSISESSRSWSGILLAVSLLVLASSVGYAVVAPPADEGFTELYVQSDDVTDETTSLYPSTLVRGQDNPFEFGVTNQEGERTDYSYVVKLQRVDRPTTPSGATVNSSGNGTSSGGGNFSAANASTEVVVSTEVDNGSFELGPGETRNVTSRVTPQATGDDLRVVLLVYEGDPPQDPTLGNAYRALRLPIEVITAEEADDGDVLVSVDNSINDENETDTGNETAGENATDGENVTDAENATVGGDATGGENTTAANSTTTGGNTTDGLNATDGGNSTAGQNATAGENSTAGLNMTDGGNSTAGLNATDGGNTTASNTTDGGNGTPARSPPRLPRGDR